VPYGLHEPRKLLSDKTVELHRALRSLIEELEAIDWYAQRIDASGDARLRNVLLHSLREEKDHASMTLEWIRRNDAGFAESLAKFLHQGEAVRPRAAATDADEGASDDETEPSLGIGSLRTGEA
jgi:ferritin-like protein